MLIAFILIAGCESSLDLTFKDSRASINFTTINIPDGYVRPDSFTTAVFRSKVDEDNFFNTHPIMSALEFPTIDYNQNDVVGICIGVRQSVDTYVEIDSLILVNNSRIEVYATEHYIIDITAAEDHPLHFVKIDKYNLGFEFKKPIVVYN